LALASGACEKAPKASLEGAQAALAEDNFSQAVTQADAGLAKNPDDFLAWRLTVKLEAAARGGDAATAKEVLQAVAGDQPIKPSHYVQTAQRLREADQAAEAIQALNMGKKKFPKDEAIDKTIAQAKQDGSDTELEAFAPAARVCRVDELATRPVGGRVCRLPSAFPNLS
jgi:predicted Zn-dependent protease